MITPYSMGSSYVVRAFHDGHGHVRSLALSKFCRTMSFLGRIRTVEPSFNQRNDRQPRPGYENLVQDYSLDTGLEAGHDKTSISNGLSNSKSISTRSRTRLEV